MIDIIRCFCDVPQYKGKNRKAVCMMDDGVHLFVCRETGSPSIVGVHSCSRCSQKFKKKWLVVVKRRCIFQLDSTRSYFLTIRRYNKIDTNTLSLLSSIFQNEVMGEVFTKKMIIFSAGLHFLSHIRFSLEVVMVTGVKEFEVRHTLMLVPTSIIGIVGTK